MSRWIEGFKVVRKERDGWYSSHAGAGHLSPLSELDPLRYEVNNVTKPKRDCGPIAVFSDDICALDFMYDQGYPDQSYELFECLYIKSKKDVLCQKHYVKAYVPFGTDFASSVKLVKIYGEEIRGRKALIKRKRKK